MQLSEMEKFTSCGSSFTAASSCITRGGAPSLPAHVAAATIWKAWEILGLVGNFGIDGKIWIGWKILEWEKFEKRKT